ncbi:MULTISPECIES: hypothetical protein [Halomonadaceae]|uniref:hypothetical protein n=1 Tax=Halomonadaceae TaxID=28256 RepID=UPI0004E2CA5F|nr:MULTISPECIES: hypothetical protein [Halomonas]KFC50273.1 hypothetical protein DK37_14000 [Halomonas sp. SUBG004]MCG7576977.1 hypothetical protein [Halomonas sp. MMH1-48]MCG7591348.1 hypothetical protein [Halomonas sp. McD50-5]MCG7604040.1 hypothetical protein [Halomonas sp. MM17-34]MCG7613152.1 hypothetical protein [Halomonas sp. MM17-29]|tara:strand:- start:658 stop:969 length:312 start_codon:yes stop_codon:yes gene_type:complete
MHQHVEWDEPGSASVAAFFKNDPDHTPPYPGAILSARYQGRIVRVKVEAYREEDAVSIGSVAAILDQHGHRFQSHKKLNIGDMVRLPDDKRAMERWEEDEEKE